MKFNDFIKKNFAEICFLILAVFLPFLLMNVLAVAFLGVFSILGVSFLFFYLRYKETIQRNKEQSALCFFASLLESIEKGYGFQQSYEGATKYLIGYHDVPPFDELMESGTMNLDLGKYQRFLGYLIEAEKNNEVHLKNYTDLIKETEEDISLISSKMNKISSYHVNTLISLVSTFSIIGVLMNLFPTIFESIVTPTFCLIECLCLASLFLFLGLSNLMKLKGVTHVIHE